MKSLRHYFWLPLVLCFPFYLQAQPALFKAKISHQTLYLFGSIHVGSPKLYPLPSQVMQAFNQSSRLWVETDLSQMDDQVRMTIHNIVKLPHGQTLRDILSQSLYQRLSAKAHQLHLDMNTLDSLKPWYVSIMLSEQFYHQSGYSNRYGIDQYFITQAHQHMMPIQSFETISEQFHTLEELANPQHTMLKESLTNPHVKTMVKQMVKRWRAGEIDALYQSLAKMQKTASDQQGMKKLLQVRNQNWLTQLTAITKQPPQFIVVGALHLAGPHGLLNQLKQAGYTITRVTKKIN